MRASAQKRGGDSGGSDRLRVTLQGVEADDASDTDILEIHEALERLSAMDERKARVVELRFFGGLAMEEVARELDVSLRTIESDWFMARAWLRSELEND